MGDGYTRRCYGHDLLGRRREACIGMLRACGGEGTLVGLAQKAKIALRVKRKVMTGCSSWPSSESTG